MTTRGQRLYRWEPPAWRNREALAGHRLYWLRSLLRNPDERYKSRPSCSGSHAIVPTSVGWARRGDIRAQNEGNPMFKRLTILAVLGTSLAPAGADASTHHKRLTSLSVARERLAITRYEARADGSVGACRAIDSAGELRGLRARRTRMGSACRPSSPPAADHRVLALLDRVVSLQRTGGLERRSNSATSAWSSPQPGRSRRRMAIGFAGSIIGLPARVALPTARCGNFIASSHAERLRLVYHRRRLDATGSAPGSPSSDRGASPAFSRAA
jgi:hypothetical protein